MTTISQFFLLSFRHFIRSTLNFWLFIGLSIGIISGRFFSVFLFSLFLFISIILLILGYFFYRRRKLFISDLFILIVFISIGGLWNLSSSHHLIYKFLDRKSRIVFKVVSLPQLQKTRNTCWAEIKTIDNIPCNIRIKINDYTRTITYRNFYEGEGKIKKCEYHGRCFYSLSVSLSMPIKLLPMCHWGKITQNTEERFLSFLKNNLPERIYRFIASIFLGRIELLKKEDKQIFTNAGVSHLLAISGQNMCFTSIVVFFVLKLFNVKYRLCLIISAAVVFFYVCLIGMNPAVLRSAIMYGVLGMSFLVKRKTNPFNSLALAGIICLLINSQFIFDIGFQLSFSSVFAMMAGFKLFPLKLSNNFFCWVKVTFLTSFFVTVFITPLVSYYFGRVYFLSIFYNIILIPFFTFIMVITYVLIIFSWQPFIVGAIGSLLSFCFYIFLILTQQLGGFMFTSVNYTFSPWLIFFYYSFLAALCVLFFMKRKRIIPGG